MYWKFARRVQQSRPWEVAGLLGGLPLAPHTGDRWRQASGPQASQVFGRVLALLPGWRSHAAQAMQLRHACMHARSGARPYFQLCCVWQVKHTLAWLVDGLKLQQCNVTMPILGQLCV